MKDLKKPKFTDDHDPSRSELAFRFLNDLKYLKISLKDFINEFEEIVKFHMVTPEENRILRNKTYDEVEEIKLTTINNDERKKIFGKNTPIKEKRKLIDEILDR